MTITSAIIVWSMGPTPNGLNTLTYFLLSLHCKLNSKPYPIYIITMSASFANGNRPYITIHIQGTDGQFKPIKGILDTGNDITLLTPASSADLGLTQGHATGQFNVKGIGAKPMVFNNVKLLAKVQDTEPVWIRAGAQIPTGGQDQLRDNLFGRKDILDKFDIVMSKGKIELHQTAPSGGYNALGLSLPRRPVGESWDYKSELDEGCPFSNC